MKITFKLLGCAAAGLLLLALASHHPADATNWHEPSETLAETMDSHGIELNGQDAGPHAAATPVVYSPPPRL